VFNGLDICVSPIYLCLMKNLCLLGVLLISACGGNLSDEQRKKFKEGMEQQKIVRITEPEIMTASLDKGHEVIRLLDNQPYSKSITDSIANIHQVKIRFAVPGEKNALAVEQELIEAYVAGMASGSAVENIQKIYSDEKKSEFDTLLYSKPSISKLSDGSEQLDGIWNIYIPKKQIVLSISKSK
jgi:hypothetical protein